MKVLIADNITWRAINVKHFKSVRKNLDLTSKSMWNKHFRYFFIS
jgi:hypothetical protein